MPPGPILLPLDNPASAPGIIHVARIVGAALGRELIVAHAAGRPLWPGAVLARIGLSQGEVGGCSIVPLDGDPAEAVLALAARLACGLVVMGLPSPRGVREGLGAVRESILAAAACPVLMVPPGLDETWGRSGRVLLPHDGTPSTTATVPIAAAFARALHARLVILHVAAVLPAEAGALGVPRFMDQPQHEWEAWRKEFLARCDCPTAAGSEEPELMIGVGRPEDAALAMAAKLAPDAIVLGWHGRLDRDHAAVLKAVLLRSAWPVLVYRVGS
jgi:nucleotide-binding universal stress UspA family protein